MLKMYNVFTFAFVCALFTVSEQRSKPFSKSPYDKLLVVSYDGFRYDYLDMNLTPYLNSLKKYSSYAKCLLNVFPTQTYTNHFSIATGMYSETHGVIGNKVYDKKKDKLLPYSYDLFHYNENILPIWAVNEMVAKDRHSGVMMWAGGEFVYNNVNITFTQPFNMSMPWKKRVSTAISWFKHRKTPANLVMMYFEEPDEESHTSGPAPVSRQTRKSIRRVDRLTEYIINSLRKHDLTDVNVVFLSDHGMEGVTLDRIIDLTAFVGNKTNMYGNSPVLQIYPKTGEDLNEIYNLLNKGAAKNKHFKVYLKENIPEHFHIKNCERTAPILAVADPPYAFQDYYSAIDWQIKNKQAATNGIYGIHGYDPLTINMHPYFIAYGPLFKENHAAGELRTVDMFSLFSHILKLPSPPVKTNGSFSGVEDLFKYNHHLRRF